MHSPSSKILPFVFLVVLVVFSLLFRMALGVSDVGATQLLMMQCLIVLTLSTAPLFVSSGGTPFLSIRMAVCLVFVLLFVLWPIGYLVDADVSVGYLRLWSLVSVSALTDAMWYVIVGVFFFHLAYLMPIGGKLVRRRRSAPMVWSKKRIALLGLVATIAALLSTGAAWFQVGGIGAVTSMLGRVKVNLDGYHYLTIGIMLLRVSILVSWTYSIIQGFPRWVIFLQVILFSGIAVVLGGRSQVVSLWLMLFLLYFLLTYQSFSIRRFFSFRFLFLGGAVFFASAALLVVVRAFRAEFDVANDSIGSFILSSLGDVISVFLGPILREFDQLEVFALVVAITPAQIPFWNGQSYIDILTLPIPRSIWAEKPVPARLVLGQLLRGRDIGIPITIIGEFYINFRIFGVIFGMSLTGIVCRMLDRWAYLNRGDPWAAIVFAFILTNTPIILTRFFYGWFGALVIFVVVFWLAVKYVSVSNYRYRQVNRLSGRLR